MKTFWKRFVVWVINLKNNPFTSTQLQLTIIYTLVIVSGILFYLTLLHREFTEEAVIISNEISNPTDSRRQRFINRATRLATLTLYSIQPEDVFMFFVVIGISYVLAGFGIRPLKKIVENQKNFLAEASHELRTPLSIIKADLEIFLQQNIKDFKSQKDLLLQRQAAGRANRNEIERIQLILDNLLFLSRNDTYQETFITIPFLLDSVIDQAIIRMRYIADRKEIELIVKKLPKVSLLGDSIRMEQAIVNILKNAIKYTNKGGKIIVSSRREKNNVSIVISDTGVGISKEDLPYLYQRFFRGNNKGKQTEGIGLGLTITKMILEKHNGNIHIASELGKGTTVTIKLPLHTSAQALPSN